MLGTDDSYFFQQKGPKRFQQRRAKKYDETQSVYSGVTFHIGERGEGDTTSVVGGGAASVVSQSRRLARPETASMWSFEERGGC